MTEPYRARLSGWGIDGDALEEAIGIPGLHVRRKGELTPPATIAEKENHIYIEEVTSYEAGFEPAVDLLLAHLGASPNLAKAFKQSVDVELQIWVSLDDENRVPSIHLNTSQLKRLSELGVDIDVDFVRLHNQSRHSDVKQLRCLPPVLSTVMFSTIHQ